MFRVKEGRGSLVAGSPSFASIGLSNVPICIETYLHLTTISKVFVITKYKLNLSWTLYSKEYVPGASKSPLRVGTTAKVGADRLSSVTVKPS